jgi:type II secretory pathway component PulL
MYHPSEDWREMRKKLAKVALVLAGVTAFGGIGVAQAATTPQHYQARSVTLHRTFTPGNYKKDCHTARTQRELNRAERAHVVIVRCTPDGPGTMMIWWHY